jgi:hypothetical protein
MEKIHGPLRRVAAGQALFTQGEPATATYTVVNGWVGLGDVLRDGRAVMLHIVMPGDIISLEYQGARSARGAVALTDVTLCSLSQSAHDALRREDHLYDRRYQAAVASELHFAYEHAADIALTTALERIASSRSSFATRSRAVVRAMSAAAGGGPDSRAAQPGADRPAHRPDRRPCLAHPAEAAGGRPGGFRPACDRGAQSGGAGAGRRGFRGHDRHVDLGAQAHDRG